MTVYAVKGDFIKQASFGCGLQREITYLSESGELVTIEEILDPQYPRSRHHPLGRGIFFLRPRTRATIHVARAGVNAGESYAAG
jgi:hypothetical protein